MVSSDGVCPIIQATVSSAYSAGYVRGFLVGWVSSLASVGKRIAAAVFLAVVVAACAPAPQSLQQIAEDGCDAVYWCGQGLSRA